MELTIAMDKNLQFRSSILEMSMRKLLLFIFCGAFLGGVFGAQRTGTFNGFTTWDAGITWDTAPNSTDTVTVTIAGGSFMTGLGGITVQYAKMTVVSGGGFGMNVGSTDVFDIDGDVDFTTMSVTFASGSKLEVEGDVSGSAITQSGTFEYNGGDDQNVWIGTNNNVTFSGAGTKIISGALIVNGTFTPGSSDVEYSSSSTQTVLDGAYGDLTFSGGGEKQIGGTVTFSGTFTPGTGKVTYNGTSQTVLDGAYTTLALDGSGTHVISGTVSATSASITDGVSLTYSNSSGTIQILKMDHGTGTVTFDGAGTKEITASTTAITNLTFTSPTTQDVTVSNTTGTVVIPDESYDVLTFTGAGMKEITGTSTTANSFSTDQAGTVQYNSASTQSVLNASYGQLNLTGGGLKTISGSTTAATLLNTGGSNVEYNGSSTQPIVGGTYGADLIFSGSGSKNITSTFSVTGELDAGSTTVNVTGSGAITGVGTFTASTSTFNYDVSGNITPLGTYNNISFGVGGDATTDLVAALDVNGSLTIDASTNLSTNGYQVNVAGDFVTNGTYLAESGTVVFDGSSTQNVGGTTTLELYDATINNSITLAGDVDINSAGEVTIGGTTPTITTSGNALTFKSDGAAAFAQIVTASTVPTFTGDVTMEGYINVPVSSNGSGKHWWHLGFPVPGSVAQIQNTFPVTGSFTGASTGTGLSGQSMYYYNEAEDNASMNFGWESFPSANTDPVTRGTGYGLYLRDNGDDTSPGVISVSGAYTEPASIAINVGKANSGNGDHDGWNLIANPFMCTIDWTAVGLTNVVDGYYVWDATTEGWIGYEGGPVGSGNQYIPPFQGFWVQATGSGSVTIEQADKAPASLKAVEKIASPEDELIIRVQQTVTDAEGRTSSIDASNVSVMFNEYASSFDDEYDSRFLDRNMLTDLFSESELLDIYTLSEDGVRHFRNVYPYVGEDIIPIVVHTNGASTLEIVLENSSDMELYFIDKVLGEEILISDVLEYEFTTTEGVNDISDRFEVKKLEKIVLDAADENIAFVSIDNNPSSDGVFTLKTDNLSGVTNIVVTSVGGGIVYEETLSIDSFYGDLDLSNLSKGVYIIELSSDNLKFKDKLVIQ